MLCWECLHECSVEKLVSTHLFVASVLGLTPPPLQHWLTRFNLAIFFPFILCGMHFKRLVLDLHWKFDRIQQWINLVVGFSLFINYDSLIFKCLWYIFLHYLIILYYFGRSCVLKVPSVLLGFPVYFKVSFQSIIEKCLVSLESVLKTFFQFLILLILALSLSLFAKLADKLSVLFIFSKNQAFEFCLFFFKCLFVNYFLNHYYFYLIVGFWVDHFLVFLEQWCG